jgi:predicted O-linked N-acetylglucosamine transferase (SPINDLY family)
MKPVWGLLNHHDRERFEVHLFSDAAESRIEHGRRPDPRDRFHDTTALSNQDVAGLIREVGIDILVDLNGYSAPARLPLFALRPAPVMVAWFNMYATTGMDCFDYLVGDEHVIPEDEEAFYTERIVRVPGCYLTFEVAYPVPDVAPPPCLARGSITFGCLASQHKINADVLATWAEILDRCPDSRLLLKNARLGSAANREFVLARLADCGLPQARVQLDGPADHFRFLEAYAEVDVALDTFPYNGGTTTTEALWQGVPVLTFPGDRWASRQSASLLRSAGLGEFVARDRSDYIDQAVALAGSPGTPAMLAKLRRTMRSQLRQAPVCDTEAFARSMEQEYLRMWREKT